MKIPLRANGFCSRSIVRAIIVLTATLMLPISFGSADIWYTQDTTSQVSPDPQDIFFSNAFIRIPTSGGLNLVFDNPALFGLSDGDNIDAIHHELRPIQSNNAPFFPGFVFSVDRGTLGQTGTDVNQQVPNNAADIFESNGFQFNALVASSTQIGANDAGDVDGFMLTPRRALSRSGAFFISLTPGSPTLANLGASGADIIAVRIGGTPSVSIKASQLGLVPTDDLDGLVMVGGFDGNQNGNFTEPGDRFPMIIFSVNPWARGLAGTDVRNEQATEGPIGADIFFSSASGTNNLFRDETFSGLLEHDDINGLDLASLAVTADEPGDGVIIPPGNPFGGGGTTPGAPGTPTGPPLPPPPGPVECVVVGLCKTGAFESGTCKVTLTVETTCGRYSTNEIEVCCDDCDDGNGSELDEAVARLAAALAGLRTADGQQIFAGAGAVNRTSPGHSQSILGVNPNLMNCQVTGLITTLEDCVCYTQNVDPKLVDGGVIDDPQIKINTFGRNRGGVFMLQVRQEEEPVFVEVAGGADFTVIRQIAGQLLDRGFRVRRSRDGGICVSHTPDGRAVPGVFGAGFVEGGSGNMTIGFTWSSDR